VNINAGTPPLARAGKKNKGVQSGVLTLPFTFKSILSKRRFMEIQIFHHAKT
jgi:hypothetical protein